MLLFPKKPKFTKMFSGKKAIKHVKNKNFSLRFGNYCIIANQTGILTNFQMEAVRKYLRRCLKKKCQLFFRIFPYLAITKKQAETRLGRGKGKTKY